MTDDEFLVAFEECTLPFEEWTHSAHVRAAYLSVSQHDLTTAIDRMRNRIQRYNAANNVPEALERGYHETITVAFMRLVDAAFRETGPHESAEEFGRQHPELLDKRVLLEYYSRDRIMSWDAKRGFIEPDLLPLPLHRCGE